MAGTAMAASTKVDLLLADSAAKPGDTILAGVRMKMPAGWHTYWRYPGDAGIATKINWELPKGVSAGAIEWPVPEKLVEKPLTSYIYTGEIMLLVPLQIAADAPAGPLTLKATVKWQECEKECLLGQTDVSTPLVIGTETKPSTDAAAIDAAKTKLPATASTVPVTAHWEKEAENRPLIIEWTASNPAAQVDFFPYENKDYDVHGDTDKLPDAGGKTRIRKVIEKADETNAWPVKMAGLLVSRDSGREPWLAQEVSFTIPALTAGNSVAPTTTGGGTASLPLMLCFAFLGGLILNIMPCVLPVIALKVLAFVNQAKEAPGRVRKLGLVYGAGVLVSFLALAFVAIGVQHAGGLASWSSPFQNPQFRMVLTILMTLVALNLFGVFEVAISGRAMGVADELASKSGLTGAFFNGVLAALLATPCTAPFLAASVGFAFTQSPATIVLVFLMIGAGLAAPFVLLCWQPAWLSFLPKPGLWMQRVKVALGFPMLATAVALFWITGTHSGAPSGLLLLGMFLVVLAFSAWIWGEFVQRGTKHRVLAMAFSFLLVGGAYGYFLEGQLHWRSSPVASAKRDGIDWQPWSADAVARARAEGHPVLVDFTADTCLNCQLNKIRSIDVAATREKLKQINAVTLVADFTDENPVIAKELRNYGRAGVPLVLVYPADKTQDPIVMPDGLFSPAEMQAALEKAGKESAAPVSTASNALEKTKASNLHGW